PPYSLCVLFIIIHHPPLYTLLPYTTLFRSPATSRWTRFAARSSTSTCSASSAARRSPLRSPSSSRGNPPRIRSTPSSFRPCSSRSEEHTSELQSRFDLVCRLLLEKKKINSN